MPDDNDSLLQSYIIRQTQINWLDPSKARFWGTFFAPYPDTLRYSEAFSTTSLLTLPLVLAGQTNPLTIFNFGLLLALVLTTVGCFYLFDWVTDNPALASLGALIFNFSGFHWHYLPHLQVFGLWLIPTSIYLFLRWKKKRQSRFLILLLTALTLQAAETFFYFYLCFLALLLLYLFRPFRLTKKEVYFCLIAGLIWGWLAYPYWQLTQEFPDAQRDIRDAAYNGLSLNEVFSKYYSLILGLAAIFSFSFWRRRKNWFWVMLTGLILALGPVLKFNSATIKIFHLPIPLPYTLFYYAIPGFNGFRTPSRWIILAALAAVVLILGRLSRLRKPWPELGGLVLLLLVLAENPPPPNYPIPIRLPSVYLQVKQLPHEAVIIELPAKLWNMPDNQIESLRSVYSLEHQHRRFNGYSGFAPSGWIELVNLINTQGLTPNLAQRLKNMGITHVVAENRLKPIDDFIAHNQSQKFPQN